MRHSAIIASILPGGTVNEREEVEAVNPVLIYDDQYNIGHICTRQQVNAGLADKVAMRWISPALERTDYTFGDLESASNRAANLLLSLGVRPGDRVFILLPRSPELYFAYLGILKIQAVACSLFSNFGEDALLDRNG